MVWLGPPKHENVCPSYCDCEFPLSTTIARYRGFIPDLVKCRCGEDDPATHTLHWIWHNPNDSDKSIRGQDIVFHPTFSQGTAIVRGEQPLAADMMHFWEIRVLTALSGTDVMFGIGTDEVNLNQFKYQFVSALGKNSYSWGYSYEGRIHHNNVHVSYGQRFSQGCIVGVLLDRQRGQMEFYLNRRPMGVAFTNIPTDPHIKIYPMIASTAAKCTMRLINATSQIECLQLRAFRMLAKQPKALKELREMPGLKAILNNYWFLAPPVRYSQESTANQCDILDEAVLTSKSRLSRKHKRKDDDDDIDDLYSNAHKIAHNERNDEETVNLCEYFDEYFHYLF